jgi:exodeoxyribonuclease VII large subunit
LNVWSVRELTDHVRHLIEDDPRLMAVAVRGEISNFTRSGNGHCYFVLKDDGAGAQLNVVLFRMQAQRCPFPLDNGAKVVALGRLSLYEQKGQYQFVASEVRIDGVGELYLAFLKLKEKLSKEGLFEARRKRPVPVVPTRIGVVTSTQGAALRDILTTIRKRHRGIDVVISPAVVQGAEAPASIVAALRRLWRLAGSRRAVDVIIVARGGGSFEELNAFNHETVARAIVTSPMPVVSGVGHDTDFTIADMVADVRAATPTAAAAAVTPDHARALRQVADLQLRLRQALLRRVERARHRFESIERRREMVTPARLLEREQRRLDDLCERLQRRAMRAVEQRQNVLGRTCARLDALSPLKVMGRGFSVCRTPAGEVVTATSQVVSGQALEVCVSDGRLDVTVEAVRLLEVAGSGAAGSNPPEPKTTREVCALG